MRASSVLNLEAGMSTSSWSARRPLRMRVRKSAIGSVIDMSLLPARLCESGHVALVGHLAQADPAQAELAEVRARAAAPLAAIVVTGLVFGSAALSHHLRGLRHLLVLLVCRGFGRGVGGFVAFGLGRGRGLRVRLWVLFLQLLERGLLGLGLRLGLLLGADLRGRGAVAALVAAERHAELGEQRERLLVGGRGRRDADVHAADLVDRVVVDLREDDLLADAHVVVPAAVEALRVEPAEVADPRDRDRHQPVEELVHARVAQRHGHADGHLLAELEVRNRLAGAAHVRALAGDRGELVGGGLQHVGVLLGVAHAHVHSDLDQPRRLHRRAVAEALDQRRLDLLLVARLQARDDLCLCDGHQSIASPDFLAMRERWPPSRLMLTRVGLFDFGSTSITLEMWTGPSVSITPPTDSARCASRIERGLVCRFWMFMPSTKTRFFFGSTRSTLPLLPLSLPEMTSTVSSRRILRAMATTPPGRARRSS